MERKSGFVWWTGKRSGFFITGKKQERTSGHAGDRKAYTVFTVLESWILFVFLEIGPIVTSLNEVVGDVIGVVQGGIAAIGIQALNVKTLAGFPYELKDQVIYRKETPTSELTVSSGFFHGSSLRYAFWEGVLRIIFENRRRDRIKTVCYAENCIPAPKLERDDADIKGCSFALFACEKGGSCGDRRNRNGRGASASDA